MKKVELVQQICTSSYFICRMNNIEQTRMDHTANYLEILSIIANALGEFSELIKDIQSQETKRFETTPSKSISDSMIALKREQLMAFNSIRDNIDEAENNIRFYVNYERVRLPDECRLL